jgi:endonuclease/exonuclease/phosphatase family metal-dependent hydrolase
MVAQRADASETVAMSSPSRFALPLLLRALFACAALAACADGASAPARAAAPGTLKIATWNLEWLVSPEAMRALQANCAPAGTRVRGAERRLSCELAHGKERAASDFAALERYARRLDADVIALQEVDGESAARLVFREHEFCFTGSRGLQNNGFAIRKGLPFRCGPDLRAIAERDNLRRGAELALFPGEPHEIRLLGLHLKSGCPRAPLTGSETCRRLARQVPPLVGWIEAQVAAGRRFVVVGDFNRELLREGPEATTEAGTLRYLWPALATGPDGRPRLVNTAAGERFVNCAPGQAFKGYIDYVLLGGPLKQEVVPGSFERLTYSAADASRRKLSDHCPVAITVRLPSAP